METFKIPSGVLKGRTGTVVRQGESCGICEGPCKYGTCMSCNGHSEHNYGCNKL